MPNHNEPSYTNGKNILLWVNCLLTGLVFPVLILIGIRLWDKLESNSEKMVRIDERQQVVMKTIPELQKQIEDLRGQIHEHTRNAK